MADLTNEFDAELNRRLAALREQGLYRELRRIDSPQSPRITVAGRALLNFSSNDYLGLANDPALKQAAIEAIERYGAGAGASRLVCGSLAPHHELDESLAAFKGVEAALSFSTGYAAAMGAICALLGKDDVIVLDKLVHACIIDAARLSGAKLRVFAHNDLNDLDAILKWVDRKAEGPASKPQSAGTGEPQSAASNRRPRTLIVTESVFSMDGDHAPLREIVELKDKYGAWLMVDEAHATGVYGANRRGLADALGVGRRIEIQMGTLGKALGASGGYLCGSRALVDYLINRARTFIFSTAPVPAAAAAAAAGLRLVQSPAGAQRCNRLWQRIAELRSGLSVPETAKQGAPGAIIPLLIGDETKAVEAAAALRSGGVFIPAIRYPTVARGSARLRLTLTAAHSSLDVAQLLTALKALNLAPPPSL
jgi:7-keto-8-aminopelargonate synthetase-like enzyme